MLHTARRLAGRAATAAAVAAFDPDAAAYAHMTMGSDEVTGWLTDDVVAWAGAGPWGPVVCVLGPAADAAAAGRALVDAGELRGARWLHLPRTPPEVIAAHLTVSAQDDWDFRWTVVAPPWHPAESRVVALTSDADLTAANALLERAFAATTTRPGDPRVTGWYGIWDGDELVAAGGDRSRGGVGFLAGLTVATERRGEGLGTALTTGMTRLLVDRYGVAGLGVMADNTGAARLYERLGYESVLARSSVAPIG